MCTKSHNHMKYSSWETELDKIFLSFWAIFCPLTIHPPKNPEKQNFEMKKVFGDVITLNLCNSTIIWCMLTQIWSPTDTFALSPHFWHQKWKFGKKVKITWTYYPFTHMYHKSRSYDDVPEILSTTERIILSFRAMFSPNNPENQNFEKKEKNSWRHYHFKHE